MTKKNQHTGLSFDSWLDEKGIREKVTAAAVKCVTAMRSAKRWKSSASIRMPASDE